MHAMRRLDFRNAGKRHHHVERAHIVAKRRLRDTRPLLDVLRRRFLEQRKRLALGLVVVRRYVVVAASAVPVEPITIAAIAANIIFFI